MSLKWKEGTSIKDSPVCQNCSFKQQRFAQIQAAQAEHWPKMKSSSALSWGNSVLLGRRKHRGDVKIQR